jgi:hypothetical protein
MLPLLTVACSGTRTEEFSQELSVPEAITDGDVQVSCIVDCADAEQCDEATVFVSACAENDQGTCYEVKPADQKGGNTYIVSLDSKGEGDALEGVTCKARSESGESLPVDLLFVIDTTSSMAGAIQGVVDSINAFVNRLAEEKVDVRIGGIAFGDAAPLTTCTAPATPFSAFTKKFGAGSNEDPESFNAWLAQLSASYCGDGGGDGPENALDALEFALGKDPNAADTFTADAFKWSPGSLHAVMVITDVEQHQKSDMANIAHFDLADVQEDVQGFAVVHVVGPDFGCFGTPAAHCECNVTPYTCDAGCGCDPMCPTPGCTADMGAGYCDDPTQTCDIDCAGYEGSKCDLSPNSCDYASDDPTTPCADDVDCAGGVPPGTYKPRRCEPTPREPYADMADLAAATHGTFTVLPSGGNVDLTKLPLAGVLIGTEQCDTTLPASATAVRCVYKDSAGHAGEVTVNLK